MENFVVGATKSSPAIFFDAENGILEITGRSYPENVAKFYAPVFEWLERFLASVGSKGVTVNLEMVYLNSSSTKAFMNMFDALERATENGTEVTVNWRYNEENETALECGEEFMEDLERVTFNLVRIPKD
jgi:hypothetical protein